MKKITSRISDLLVLCSVAVMVTFLSFSCSKDSSADLKDLMSTVPSDAALVGAFDAANLFEKAGCKVSDDKVELTPAAKSALEKQLGSNPQNKILADAYVNGESGIAIGAMVFFTEGTDGFITGMLNDPVKFKDVVVKNAGNGSFTEDNGVEVLNNVAVKGNQYWIGTATQINAKDINRFAALSKEQSFISNSNAEKVMNPENDCTVWGNLNGLMNLGKVSFGNMATTRMVLSTLFDDAQDFILATRFGKGTVDTDAQVLNSRGDQAKFLLPSSKIDSSVVKGIGGTAAVVGAMSIEKKLVDKIKEIAQSFGGSLPSLYTSALDVLSGTSAMAANADMNAYKAVVSTTGEGTSTLTGFLNSLGTVTKDGKLLKIEKGTPEGSMQVSDAASQIDGAFFGVVVSGEMASKTSELNAKDGIETLSVSLMPTSDSMSLKCVMRLTDKSHNALQTLVENWAK